MNTLTISMNHNKSTNIEGKTIYYDALNAQGRGKKVAVISGEFEVVSHQFGDSVKLADGTYALREVLSFAKRGERGLTLTEAI
jgi:hypothetical protein